MNSCELTSSSGKSTPSYASVSSRHPEIWSAPHSGHANALRGTSSPHTAHTFGGLSFDWFVLIRNLFELFDLKIDINGFDPIVALTDCHSRHVTMSIFRLLQVGLPASGS